MRTSNVLIALALVFILTLGLVYCGGGGDGTPPAVARYTLNDYLPTATGNSWTYSEDADGSPQARVKSITGTEILNGIDMFIEEDSYSGDKSWITQDTHGTQVHKILNYDDAFFTFPEGAEIYPYRMAIGEEKTTNDIPAVYTDGGSDTSGTISGSIKLLGIENVTVAAGAYEDCLKITGQIIFTMPGLGEGTLTEDYTEWLAKDIGLVKYTREEKEFDGDISNTTGQLVNVTIN